MGALLRGAAFRTVVSRSLAASVFVVLAATPLRWLGYALVAAALIAMGAARLLGDRTSRHVELALLAAAVVANSAVAGGLAYAAAGLLLIAAAVNEPVLALVYRHDKAAANLSVTGRSATVRRYAFAANMALTAGLAGGVLLDLPAWPFVVANAAACAVYGATVLRRMLRRAQVEQEVEVDAVRAAVEALEPTFMLYHSGPKGSEFHVTMWLPYLERLGRPFFVLLREPHALAAVAAATSAPVVVCPSLVSLEDMIVPSLKTVFYANNGMKNTHCVRFSHLTHIQLLHGDSEKPPSYNPVTAMFDRIFVAGQAGIDRYAANGVSIPAEKFAIVGRPQVADIEAARGHMWDLTDKVVLYAPTWTGHFTDTNYCSLPVAEPLIRELLEQKATIILRSHPYTSHNRASVRQLARLEELLAADRARSGRQHVWGTAATADMSLVECFNRADAMVADVSSVISDFVFSGKPFAITDMTDDATLVDSLPIARAAYVLRRDMSNVADVATRLLETDPAEDVRQEMRVHYLGDFPRESYVDAFLSEAGRHV